MERLDVEVAFDGKWAADGEIDLLDFAPTALALAEAIVSANAVLSSGTTEVRAMLRPNPKKGSYLAELALVIPDNVTTTGAALVVGAVALQQVVKALFGKDGALPILERFFGDKSLPPTSKKAANAPGIAISNETVKALLQNPAVVKSLEKMVQRMGERDTLRVRPLHAAVEDHPPITHATARAIRRAADSLYDDTSNEFESTMVLELSRPSLDFVDDWGFRLGKQRIRMKMEDDAFRKQVERGEVVFRRGDVYHLRVATVTKKKRTTGALEAVYRCMEVVKRIPGTGPQLRLPL